jgi:hypothetical protein
MPLPPRKRHRKKMDALLSMSNEVARSRVVAQGIGAIEGDWCAVIKVDGVQVTGPIKGKKAVQAALHSHYMTFSMAVRHVETYLRDMEREGRI